MKRLFVLVATILLGTSCLAVSSSKSTKLNSLALAFKKHSTVQPTIDKNDIEIGYAGADVSKPDFEFSHMNA